MGAGEKTHETAQSGERNKIEWSQELPYSLRLLFAQSWEISIHYYFYFPYLVIFFFL